MKIRIVSSKEEIDTIDENEQVVHIAFRPSNKDILILIQKCPKLKAIHIPTSFIKTISKSTQILLEMRNITLLEGDVWGHRKDIHEYYEIKPQIIKHIDELKDQGKSEEEIIYKLSIETRLSRDLIKFLL